MCSAKTTYMYINGIKYHTCPTEGCNNAQSGPDYKLCNNCFNNTCMSCNTIKNYKIKKHRTYGKACQDCLPKLKKEYETNCAVCTSCYDESDKFRCSKHYKYKLTSCLNCKSKYFTICKVNCKKFMYLDKINGLILTTNNCCDTCIPKLENENARIKLIKEQKAAADKLELEALQKQFYDSYHLEITYKCELYDYADINNFDSWNSVSYLTKSYTVVEYRPLPKSIRQCDIDSKTGLVKKLDRLPPNYTNPSIDFMDFDVPSNFNILYAYVRKIETIELS
jgi:hypothetical protein